MRKKLIMLAILAILLLSACSSPYVQNNANNTNNSPEWVVEGSRISWTFEEMLLSTTDVVVARYVGHRYFGYTFIEFEFTVLDRVLGNAADTIFLYEFRSRHLSLNAETEYLLLLGRVEAPFYWGFHNEAFMRADEVMIDLNNLSASTMRNEPLSEHSTGLDFNNSSLSREQVVSYVRELTRDNAPSNAPIRTDRLENIIDGSPDVLVIEINEPLRLLRDIWTPGQDFMETDLYHFTVIQGLKGGLEEGYRGIMVFFADTVQTGERHIVAAVPVSEGSNWFDFTTRESLFHMDQLDEILAILAQQNETGA